MTKRIARENLPVNLPVLTSVVTWLVLDRLDAPGWVCGGVWAFVILFWMSALHNVLTDIYINVLKDK